MTDIIEIKLKRPVMAHTVFGMGEVVSINKWKTLAKRDEDPIWYKQYCVRLYKSSKFQYLRNKLGWMHRDEIIIATMKGGTK